MLPESVQKSELSYAYVHAIAAYVGYSCERDTQDYDSVDATIKARGWIAPESVTSSPRIELQLKATARKPSSGRSFNFELPIKNYNDLRDPESMCPRLLVVFCLPPEYTGWLDHGAARLIWRRCGYWLNLAGSPAVSNSTKKTVRLFRRNVFSPEALKVLMYRASLRGGLGYEI